MLDLKYIRENTKQVIENCKHRNLKIDVPKLLELDEQTRALQYQADQVRQRRNEISTLMKGKLSTKERTPLVEEAKLLKTKTVEIEEQYQSKLKERQQLLSKIPNMTHPESPIGQTEEDNLTLREVGQIPEFEFEPKDHLELMEHLDWIDFAGGAKVVGQKFYYLKNQAVFLEFALVQYALRLLQQEGFTPFITPDLAKTEILEGIGFNPRTESTQIYSIAHSELSLIATAEITLGGLLQDQILQHEELPLLYSGFSHCFRTEAGAAGRESKGLYRVHQFSKVEMFVFTDPENSEQWHQKLLEIEEKIFQDLEIPYRVVDICTGDLGAPAYRKYDLEAWMPGRGKWGEITSTSNCTDYQSRRLNIRFKDPVTGKNRFVHMLNGTAIAISRALIALIENGQQKDGTIKLPPCLAL